MSRKDSKVKFEQFFKSATERVLIVGTNPLIPFLERSAAFFSDLLNMNDRLQLTILYESDTENFNQALCVDTEYSKRRFSYSALSVHRNRIASGFISEIREQSRGDISHIISRIELRQVNLRLPMNIILADNSLWYSFVTHSIPDLDSYQRVKPDSGLFSELTDYIEFLTKPEMGGIFLSRPGEELIQLYDKQEFPRGIFPRAAFYRTDFQRYSIWGFVFNRNGELLLHQRSVHTKDNPLLWDKSIGGHVDLRDRTTSLTAKRELVEELFLPEAEFTKYLRADLGDIVDFGDWNPEKRPERLFKAAFDGLGKADWILFRATDDDGDPMTVTRVSTRRLRSKAGNVHHARTIFMSDVFFLISPPGYLDTEEQMNRLVAPAEETGAANDHKIITIGKLSKWIEDEEKLNRAEEVFTDDLLAINLDYRYFIERFAEFVKYVF